MPSLRSENNIIPGTSTKRMYYQQYEAQLNQSLIDQKVKEHLGAFRPPVAPYPQLRPPCIMPIPGQFVPGIRPPPVLPRPPMPGPPGYTPQMMPPPGASLPAQMNGLQGLVTAPPPLILGSAGTPASSVPPTFAPPVYQGNASLPIPTSGGSDGSNVNNSQGAEANH